MGVVGKVESLWRYPVKSMAGEEREELFVGYAGVYGDRLFAVGNTAAPARFPYLTAREAASMLAYKPHFRHPEKAALPINLAEARGITPTVADPADLAVDVETPSGDRLAIDDPALLSALTKGVKGAALRLLRSERALTDCRPVSLFSLQTAAQLGAELGTVLDKRRFRANIYADLESRIRICRGCICRQEPQDRSAAGDRGARARCALQDDHPRSRYGRSEPAGPAQGGRRT